MNAPKPPSRSGRCGTKGLGGAAAAASVAAAAELLPSPPALFASSVLTAAGATVVSTAVAVEVVSDSGGTDAGTYAAPSADSGGRRPTDGGGLD